MKNSKIPNPFNKFQHHPDAKLHQEISFLKSAVLLIVSEIVGIIEEMV